METLNEFLKECEAEARQMGFANVHEALVAMRHKLGDSKKDAPRGLKQSAGT